MTVRELTKEARRRGFRTKSKDFAKNVESRCYDLQKRGLVRHPIGQPGYMLTPAATQTNLPVPSNSKRRISTTKPMRSSTAGATANQLPLNQVLVNILANSREPLPAKELARRVLESGYQTKSKQFLDVIWVALGKLKNVQNVPGVGWRHK